MALLGAALLTGCMACDGGMSEPDAAIVFDFDAAAIEQADAGETAAADAGDAGSDAGAACLAPATETDPMVVRLNPDRDVYYPEDPIRLDGLAVNVADHDLLAPSGALDPEAVVASLRIVGPDGLVTRTDGATPGDPPEWVCAEPGRSREVHVIPVGEGPNYFMLVPDLRELFELTAYGTYTLSAEIPFATYSTASGGIADEGDLEFCCGLFTLASFTIAGATAELIEAGGTYGDYAVVDVTIGAAAAGDYTFHVADPTAGEVEVRSDGSAVTTLAYAWGTTVSATDPTQYYTFDFPDLFSITVRRAGPGTSNLYGIDHSIFDGVRILPVP